MKKLLRLLPALALGLLLASCAKEEGPSRNAGKFLAQERAKFDEQLSNTEKESIAENRNADGNQSVDEVLKVARNHEAELSRILRTIDPGDFYDCEGYQPKGCDIESNKDDKDCDWDWNIDWDSLCEDNNSNSNSGSSNTSSGNSGNADFSAYSGEQIKYYNFLLLEPR